MDSDSDVNQMEVRRKRLLWLGQANANVTNSPAVNDAAALNDTPALNDAAAVNHTVAVIDAGGALNDTTTAAAVNDTAAAAATVNAAAVNGAVTNSIPNTNAQAVTTIVLNFFSEPGRSPVNLQSNLGLLAPFFQGLRNFRPPSSIVEDQDVHASLCNDQSKDLEVQGSSKDLDVKVLSNQNKDLDVQTLSHDPVSSRDLNKDQNVPETSREHSNEDIVDLTRHSRSPSPDDLSFLKDFDDYHDDDDDDEDDDFQPRSFTQMPTLNERPKRSLSLKRPGLELKELLAKYAKESGSSGANRRGPLHSGRSDEYEAGPSSSQAGGRNDQTNGRSQAALTNNRSDQSSSSSHAGDSQAGSSSSSQSQNASRRPDQAGPSGVGSSAPNSPPAVPPGFGCPVCLGERPFQVKLRCGHLFCRPCIEQVRRLAKPWKCPVCRRNFRVCEDVYTG